MFHKLSNYAPSCGSLPTVRPLVIVAGLLSKSKKILHDQTSPYQIVAKCHIQKITSLHS